jgi:hypothetical protein
VLGLTACGGDTATSSPPAVTAIAVTPGRDSLVPGSTRQLVAKATTAGGSEVGVSMTWTSANNAVATVSSAGLVTAVAPGSVEIRAQAGGVTGTATLVVRDGAVVGAAGGTVSAAQGAVALAIPAGALPATIQLSVAPAEAGGGEQVMSGASYNFGPEGTQFAQPVTLALTYDPAKLPAGLPASAIRVGYFVDGEWEPVLEGAETDAATKKVSVQIRHFSTYGVMTGNYCPRAGEPYITLQPGASWSDVNSASNTCQQTIAFSPYPEAIGKPINTHDFLVTLSAGKTYSITLSGGISGRPASLTVFRGSSVAGQSVYDGSNASTRSVQVTPATTGQYDIEVSSGGFVNGTWSRASFSYSLRISGGQ